jgi:hypothetical protein
MWLQFVHVQTVTSAIADSFPHQLVGRKRLVTLGVCIVGFVLGLPFVTQVGMNTDISSLMHELLRLGVNYCTPTSRCKCG